MFDSSSPETVDPARDERGDDGPASSLPDHKSPRPGVGPGVRSRLNRKAWYRIGAFLVVLGGGAWVVQRFAFAKPEITFRFATVEKGDLQAVVSATGTLNALTTVSVGTQVSGQVSELLVDFNDRVRKGQLLARIDPTLAKQSVADAQANLEKARSQTHQALLDQTRNRELASTGLIPVSQLDQGEAALQVAQATEKSAAIALQRAQQNLSYTSIHAPIDGVVVERNVNPGQTVAASLSAPQLFLIANDLRRMRILAQVAESDIGMIHEGQIARFTVQALPDRTFEGTVQQVRLQSTTIDNVVNYTVVIQVENPDRLLLPGMTARVDFLVKSATGVLKVPNAALRYRPSEELLAQIGTMPAPQGTGAPRRTPRASGSPGASDRSEPRGEGHAMGTLYSLSPDGRLQVLRIRTGLSDGSFTEVQGRELSEGLKVIVGLATPASTARPAANPLAGAGSGAPRRFPGGGGF